MAKIVGGFTEAMDATEEIQKICDHVKSQVQDKTKKVYEEFRAVKYKSQLVNGKNYTIKVHVGGGSHLYLKVFQSFSHDGGEIVLNGVQEDKDGTIEPF